MNKTQISAIEQRIINRVYSHFESLDKKEKIAVKKSEAMLQIEADFKKLKERITKFNATEKVKSKGNYYYKLDTAHYTSHRSLKGDESHGDWYGKGTVRHISLSSNNMRKFKKALTKAEDFILSLTLGESTLKDVESFLSKLLPNK